MRLMILAFAVALSPLAPASPASGAVSDFRLPSERPEQAPPPDLQGPVAPDVPASRRAPTPTPSVSRTETRATSPPPVEVPASLGTRASADPTPRATAPSRSAPARTSTTAATAVDLPRPEASAAASSEAVASGPLPGTTSTLAPVAREEAGWSWLWVLAAVPLLLGALGLTGWTARRWARRPVGQGAVPRIERPRVRPPPAAPQQASAAPVEPLQVSLEPLRLSLTLMNATLVYRLELANRGAAPLTGLAIGADMIAAHASMSREEQLAGPSAVNGAAQRIERIEPGETRVVEGEFRLPFPQIVPIRQGNAALLLPLARFRVEADGAQPLVRTFVVGQPGRGSSLHPFRLDQGPRVYPRLSQHAFA